MIVGDVARERDAANWFTSRPLFGRTVLVTRPEHQADDLASKLRDLGANVLCQPAIEIAEPARLVGRRCRHPNASANSIGSSSPAATASHYFLRRGCSHWTTTCAALAARSSPRSARPLPPHSPSTIFEGRPAAGRISRRSAGRSARAARRAASAFFSPAPAAVAKCWPKCSPPPAPTSSKSSSTKAATSTTPNDDVRRRARRRQHRLDHRHQLRHRPQPRRDCLATISAQNAARRHQPADGRSAHRTRLSARRRRRNLHDRRHRRRHSSAAELAKL